MKNMISFFSVVLMLTVQGSWGQNYSWKQKADLPGMSRWGALSFSIGNFGYVGGGRNTVNLNDFWQYDPATDTWTQKSNLPVAVRTAGTFSIGGLGYFIGGIASGLINSLYEYNPVLNTWSQKAPFPGPARYGAAAFAIGQNGYYGLGNIGSSTGPFVNDFYEYNAISDTWTQKASFPGIARYGVCGIGTSTAGYAGFGFENNGATSAFFYDWWEYSPLSNSWTQKSNLPAAARSYPGVFCLNDIIYAGTGNIGASAASDFFKYDPAINQWQPLANFPGGGRWLVSSLSIGNAGYFGFGDNFNTLFNDWWEYSPDSVGTLICFTLKPDAAEGKDANILSGMPNTNTEPSTESGAIAWTCGGISCIDRALIEFDFTQIPIGSSIISAGLSLYAHPSPITTPTAMYGTNNAVLIQRITSPWSENAVTWNTQPSTTTLNQIVLSHTGNPAQNYLNIDVKNLVQDMIDYPNSYGFMLRLQTEAYYNAKNFASSDYPNPFYHPSIEVCYVAPTSVIQQEFQPRLFVYPNPVADWLFIETSGIDFIESVTVMDAASRIIIKKTQDKSSRFFMLECSNMAMGYYLITIKTSTGLYKKKIVKI